MTIATQGIFAMAISIGRSVVAKKNETVLEKVVGLLAYLNVSEKTSDSYSDESR